MFEAYSVAIRLRLIDSVSSGLISMASQFSAFNRHVNASKASVAALQSQLNKIKTMGLVGGAMLGVGAAGLALFKAPLEEAKKWQQELAKFASLGFGAKVNQDAAQFAVGMKTYGTSAVENLTLLSDAMAVFKDLGHAEIAAPLMAKMKFANEAVFGAEAGGNYSTKFMDMLKVIEFRRGLSSPAEFARQANFAQQAIAGSRGRVDQTALLQALKTGNVGISRLSDAAFYLGLEPIIQEFGGQRTGFGINAIYQNLVQGRGSIASQQELMRLGLENPKMVQYNKLGMVKRLMPGAFRGSNIFETEGPLALLQKVLLPAFAKHGITTEEQIVREIGQILSNSRGAGLLARVYQQMPTIERNVAANYKAMNIDQTVAVGKNTPEGKMLELHAKWRDVLRELGNAVLPIAIKAVEGLTTVIKAAVQFAREFPTLTKGLVISFGVLSSLVAAGGVLKLTTASFQALGLALRLAGGGGTLASGLLGAATGLGAVGTALGGIALALGAGYAVGTLIYNLTAGTKAMDFFGESIARVLAFFGSQDAQDALNRSGYHPAAKRHVRRLTQGPHAHGHTVVHTHVHLDGRKIADVVTKHQARAANTPQAATGFFDPRTALTPAAATTLGDW